MTAAFRNSLDPERSEAKDPLLGAGILQSAEAEPMMQGGAANDVD